MKWQPIETAPKDGREVLLWYFDADDPSESFMEVGCTLDEMYKEALEYGWLIINGCCPTHWMPLPEPPDENG